MSKELYQQVLSKVGPNTIGAIWFSENSIIEDSRVHAVFDYLVDGGIKKFIKYLHDSHLDPQTENNFFISDNFDHPFIVFNTCVKKDFSKQDFQDFKMILDKHDLDHNKNILVVHPKGHTLPKIIQESNLEFSEINF
jgi:hypothetical protein